MEIPIELNLIDSDGGKVGLVDIVELLSDDDVADVSPSRDRVLKLQYVPSSGKILDPDEREIERKGRILTIQGDSSKNNASITFSINHRDSIAAQ